ncbi:MAG: tail fiber domain-containing protein, partial [Saprospiraceae bacterium]|nr:tail fiber domain-containing protein [Saprospiraceae bacterium]
MKNKPFLLFMALLTLQQMQAQTQIQDTDGDTRLQTEALPNENKIRLVTAGADRLHIGANAAGITRIDVWNANQCLFIGQNAGINAQAGASNNTGLGYMAGSAITTGFANTLAGQNAGKSINTGNSNTAFGQNALLFNTSGHSNVAVGSASLQAVITGTNNTAVGTSALVSNTASENTAVGSSALQNNTSGSNNTAMGRRAAQLNTTGSANTSVGQEALRENTTGGSNTAIGRSAMLNNQTGSNNTAIGVNAGDQSSGNNQCTFLGFDADNTLNNNLNNATAIGNGARVNTSNKIRLGNSAVTVIEGQVAYTVSDGRFKTDVQENAPGLDFVMGLRPVTYHFNYPGFSGFLGEKSVDNAVLRQKEQQREMGFVAQEVETLCLHQGVELSNIVHVPDSDADNYSVAYGQLVVPLVKAVQEQQTQIAAQRAEIETLKQMVAQLLAQTPS